MISAQRLHTAVHSPEQLAALEEADLPEPVTVWMKLDTGMHRLGVLPEQAEAFYQRLSQCKNVRQPVNIVSHLPVRMSLSAARPNVSWISLPPSRKGSRGCAQSLHPAVYCYGRSRTSTGRVRGLFSTAYRRSTVDPPARILAASR